MIKTGTATVKGHLSLQQHSKAPALQQDGAPVGQGVCQTLKKMKTVPSMNKSLTPL